MNSDSRLELDHDAAIAPAVRAACARIAPTWPLDQFIAVNPYWGFLDQPIESAAATLATLSGTRLCMPRAFYRQCWESGQLRREHLERAIEAAAAATTSEELLRYLNAAPLDPPRLPLLGEHIAAQHDDHRAGLWRDFITQNISQHCGAYFDRDQASWRPNHGAGLYASWLQQLASDHSAKLLFGGRQFATRVRRLPRAPGELLSAATQAIAPPPAALEAYFSALLLSINGWAAWCAYRRWQARLQQREDDRIVELLAIRLACEWLLLEGCDDRAIVADWREQWRSLASHEQQTHSAQQHDWLWQHALEIAYQQSLLRRLSAPTNASSETRPSLQAVFCIDVRSEVFRRALEAGDDDVQTRGFAGFFGLPIAYTPLGSAVQRPQLPGLLAPTLCVSETCATPAARARCVQQLRAQRQWQQRWRAFRASASSAFAFVETLGLSYAATLLRRSLPASRQAPSSAPALPQAADLRLVLHDPATPDRELALERRCDLAASILGAMQLTRDFAPLVLLLGHGSQSANNPHAAGLECGACGGQSGEINARALATLLNDAAVRADLRELGIVIPHETLFIAGLHNTTTDEVQLYDTDRIDPAHHNALARLRQQLAEAGARARAERAPGLGLGEKSGDPVALLGALRQRANDWAQVRPEWGLADNAAFLIAPRALSRSVDFGGRVFLHDYDWRDDADRSVLAQILAGPLTVTHWINMQYYASTVDNGRYGSGNKVLHNVVGGCLGVFEGNSGDLRIGLPLQSLHDGERWRHTPLRLSVVIAAPEPAIESAIAKQTNLRQLVEHGWLHLFRIDDGDRSIHQRVAGCWIRPLACAPA